MLHVALPFPATGASPVTGVVVEQLFAALFGTPGFASSRRVEPGTTSTLSLGASDSAALTLSVDEARPIRVPVPNAGTPQGSGERRVLIAKGTALDALPIAACTPYVRQHLKSLDHIGINLSHAEVDAADWAAFVASVAAVLPAYTLDVPTRNEIVIVLLDAMSCTEGHHRALQALELVYDRTLPTSTAHVCARLDATRCALEAAFPAPHGAYKPGDEAYFLSVAVRDTLSLPFYLDLAYAEAVFPAWRDIVQFIGKRIA